MKKEIVLGEKKTFNLKPTAPFNFNATVHKPSNFPSSDCFFEHNKLYFTTYFLNMPIGVKMVNIGTIEDPNIEVVLYTKNEATESYLTGLKEELCWRFDLNTDLNDFFESYKKDNILGPVLERFRGMRLKTCYSLYEYMVITCILQNATVRRSVQMIEALFEAYGFKLKFDNHELSCFWAPEMLLLTTEEKLRETKVGYRAKTLLRQAQEFSSGQINERKMRESEKESLKKNLLKIYGVGPASVWYIMFDKFHQYDMLEKISPWEQKIYSRLIFDQTLVDESIILAEVERRWGRWKMLAIHYIFEDLFWQRKTKNISWLNELIRL
jgi:3-methyladenine DNA glycosylase/8-oxoguanine DNA glycosylase